MIQSKASEIAEAIKTDLTDWYAGDGEIDSEYVDAVVVERSYAPIWDIASRKQAVIYVTVYESTSELERATRGSNVERPEIQVALQYRFELTPTTDITDILRYELGRIADRYHGEDVTVGDLTFRSQETSFGAVNDPSLTVQQRAYFGVVQMSILDKTR